MASYCREDVQEEEELPPHSFKVSLILLLNYEEEAPPLPHSFKVSLILLLNFGLGELWVCVRIETWRCLDQIGDNLWTGLHCLCLCKGRLLLTKWPPSGGYLATFIGQFLSVGIKNIRNEICIL